MAYDFKELLRHEIIDAFNAAKKKETHCVFGLAPRSVDAYDNSQEYLKTRGYE
jgi:hypothetical protein